MSEKFRKIVNAPHKAFGRARKKIAALKPKTIKGKAERATGVAVAGMFQFLLWAVKYAALDNQALRGIEKNIKKNTKDKNSFVARNPNLSSHILYYMMMAAMVAGGNAALNKNAEIEEMPDPVKTEIVAEPEIDTSNLPVYDANTFGAYLAKMQPITPLLIAHLVSLEGVCMDENGMHVVYDDATGKALKPGEKAKGIPTIGFGSTRLANGKAVTSRTAPITTQEAYELARNHIEEGETYLVMYCYEVGLGIKFDDDKKAMMISSMVYNMGSSVIEEREDLNHRNRFEELRNMFKEYGFGIPDAKVRDLFKKYPVKNPTSFGKVLLGWDKKTKLGDVSGLYIKAGGRLAPGLIYRRWIEAGLLSGDINPMEILDIPVAGLPEFYKMMCRKVGGDKKKAFFTENAAGRHVNYSTYANFHEWVKNPVDRNGHSLAGYTKVSDVLPSDVVAQCRSGQCQVGNIMAVIRPANDEDTEFQDGPFLAVNSQKENGQKSSRNSYIDAAKKLGIHAHSAGVHVADLPHVGNVME